MAFLPAFFPAFLPAYFGKTLRKSSQGGYLLRVKLGIKLAFMVIQVGIDVDEVNLFEPLLGARFQRDEAPDGLGVDP